MRIKDYDFGCLYYKEYENDIVLDGPSVYSQLFPDGDSKIVDFLEKATTFEVIEFITYVFSKEYPKHTKIMWLLGRNFKDEDSTDIATEHKRKDIVSAKWKYFIDEHMSKVWGSVLTFKFHLQVATIEFDKPIMDAKDNVISGLDDREYTLTTTNDKHVFTVMDSPIAKIELTGNTFILTINEDKAYNYLESPRMLEE